MPLIIDDDVLRDAGLTEQEALEFACRLFDAEKLSVHRAAKLAGMDRYEFEGELTKRKIAIYRPTVEDLRQDMESFRKLGI